MNCDSCSGPLTFAASDHVVTCEHCGASHFIQEEIIPAEIVEAEIVPSVQSTLSSDLSQLKNWWDSQRKQYMRKDRRGRLHPPAKSNPYHPLMMLGLILGMGGFFAGSFVDSMIISVVSFFLFPMLFSLPTILSENTEEKYEAYQKLKTEYLKRRDDLVRKHTGT